MPSYSSAEPKTLLAVRPLANPPAHHLAAAVAGHAEVMAAVTDHLNRAYAHIDGLAAPVPPDGGQALS